MLVDVEPVWPRPKSVIAVLLILTSFHDSTKVYSKCMLISRWGFLQHQYDFDTVTSSLTPVISCGSVVVPNSHPQRYETYCRKCTQEAENKYRNHWIALWLFASILFVFNHFSLEGNSHGHENGFRKGIITFSSPTGIKAVLVSCEPTLCNSSQFVQFLFLW